MAYMNQNSVGDRVGNTGAMAEKTARALLARERQLCSWRDAAAA